jgi:hypothetical protein
MIMFCVLENAVIQNLKSHCPIAGYIRFLKKFICRSEKLGSGNSILRNFQRRRITAGLPKFGQTFIFSAVFRYQSLVFGWTDFQLAFVVTIYFLIFN